MIDSDSRLSAACFCCTHVEVTKPPPGDINLCFCDFKCCIPNNILCAVDDVTCFLLLPAFLICGTVLLLRLSASLLLFHLHGIIYRVHMNKAQKMLPLNASCGRVSLTGLTVSLSHLHRPAFPIGLESLSKALHG